jgi:hypothetical protein
MTCLIAGPMTLNAQQNIKPAPKAMDPQKMTKFLPETIIPWEGRTPTVRTEKIGDKNITIAARLWTKEDPEKLPTAEVRISDYAEVPERLKNTISEWMTTKVAVFDEIKRFVEHEGLPSFQEFNTSDNVHSWSFCVANRYLVLVEVTDVIPSEMDPWIKVFDFKGLSGLK